MATLKMQWRNESLDVDASGWRALFFGKRETDEPLVRRVVGWIGQRECWYDPKTCDDVPPPNATAPGVRFIAGIIIEGNEVAAVDDEDMPADFWCLLEPGQEQPPTEQRVTAWREHDEEEKRQELEMAKRLAAKAATVQTHSRD